TSTVGGWDRRTSSSSSTATRTPVRTAASSTWPSCAPDSARSMAMSEIPAAWGAWDTATQSDPYPLFASMRSKCPVHQVHLADGHEAWLVVGHDAARQALRDTRFSKDFV